MFVAINNTDMGLNDIEKWIKTARDNNGGVISPEFAMEILGKTNHLGHIKKVLRNIKDKCTTPEKISPYKEFILSCVDGREMSGEAMDMLQEMAGLCGCSEDEFKEANDKPKFYGKFDCNNIDVKIVKSIEEFKALRGENLKVYFYADEVYLRSCNLSKVKALKFKEGAVVYLSKSKNLPECLDVSRCSWVDLRYCDLEGLNLKFREGAVVYLSEAYNLPKDLDLSQCSKVDLFRCDLEGLNLKFREGAEVYLSGAKNLPKDLDFSQCSKVNLSGCDLSGVKEIIFKDSEQEKKFMEEAKNFNGKVIYADEDKKEKEDSSLFSRISKRFGSGEMGE